VTQFMLARSKPTFAIPDCIVVQAPDGDLLQTVASEYFGADNDCCLIVDRSGRTEPLIDDVWEAQNSRRDPLSTPFMKLLAMLIDGGVEFVCWCGSDFWDLPSPANLAEVQEQVLLQTATQPADLYVHYRPRS
jgi:hypothetical protein